MKVAVVNNQTLAMISLKYGFERFLVRNIPELRMQAEMLRKELSERKENTSQHEQPIKKLGDVFEALIGAIFVDCKFNYQ